MNRFSRLGIAVGLMLSGLAACTPPADTPEVFEKTLANGLKVIVKPDHRAPVVVAQIWYKVGASYEPEGLTGISHVLEHMMFKGTDSLKPGEFSRIIAANGGRENAFTGRDYTAYFQRLEKSRLPVSFKLEADRMRNIRMTEEEFAKEVKVVMEERRLRTEDKPESLTYERFMNTAFTTHTYKNPVIGWMEDLESLRLADLQTWYEQWYAPDNATLVVVGDVEPDEVFALAQEHYGVHEARDLKPHVPATEPAQTETRRVRVQAPAEVPYLLMGFHAPNLTSAGADTWEPYALEVLASLLGGGSASRMRRELIREKQIAAEVGVGYDWSTRSPNLFLVDANPAAEMSVEDLERAIIEQLEKIKREPVTADELNRVKAQVVASNVFERDSVFYEAMKIGGLETVGMDWRINEDYVDNIRSVTAEQVQKVARKYLVADKMTIAVLDPLPIGETPMPRTPGGPEDDVR